MTIAFMGALGFSECGSSSTTNRRGKSRNTGRDREQADHLEQQLSVIGHRRPVPV
jgi:hypothetical protein